MRSNTKTARGTGLAFSAALVAAAILPVGTPANAAAPGPYRGHAQAIALHADALTTSTTRLVNVNVGQASSALDSANLKKQTNEFGNRIVPASVEGKKSFGEGVLAQVTLGGAPDANPQIDGPLSQALTRVAAPGAEGSAKSLVNEVAVSPVLYAKAVTTTASPVWNASTCVIGAPIAAGGFQAAKVQVLEAGADTTTPDFDQAVAGVSADTAGPERGAVDTQAFNQLYAGKGEGLGLMSVAFAEIAPVTLLEGTANEFTIDVGGPAILRAMADGTAGGAKVEFDAPLVSIVQNGVRNVILPNDQTRLIELPSGGTVLRVRAGVIHEESKSATSVSASGAVLTIEILRSAAAPTLQGATIALGHLEAESVVPAGGIICPVEVEVEADPESTRTGQTVDITTTVYNRFECPLSNVVLTDTITVERAARFTITEAPGAVSKTPGTFLSRGVVKWNIGTIAAGKSASRTFTLRADDGAGKFNINAMADGTLVNCIVKPGAGGATVTGLGSGNAGVVGVSPEVDVPVTKVLGAVVPGNNLPATGVASTAAAGLGLLTMAGGVGALLRRRSSV